MAVLIEDMSRGIFDLRFAVPRWSTRSYTSGLGYVSPSLCGRMASGATRNVTYKRLVVKPEANQSGAAIAA